MGEHSKREIFKGIDGDLMEFADRISSVIGGPVTIEDESHRLLAYSMHSDITDQARISTIIGRRVPEKVINSLWKEGIIPALLKNDEPVIVKAIGDVGLGNRAAVSIRNKGQVIGFIWALAGDHPFSPENISFLHFAAKEANNQFKQLQLNKKRKAAGNQEFFWSLLTGHEHDEREIQHMLSVYSLPLLPVYTVSVFEFPKDIAGDTERHISYLLTVTQKVKIQLFTMDRNRLIVLAGAETEESLGESCGRFIPSFSTSMESRFQVKGIVGVRGSICTAPSDIFRSYQDALYTLKMKHFFPEETEGLLAYEELGILQEIERFSQQDGGRPLNSQLRKLEAYDRKHQGSLLHTLKVFLEKDCSQNEAARQLHIHVNTLNYRLKRIAEIGQINFKNPVQKMTLFLDLKIKQYQEQLQHKIRNKEG